MATDATTILIQRIQSQLSQEGLSSQTFNLDFLSQATSFLSTAANYAQILGTAAGPIANAAAASLIGSIAAEQAAGTLTAGAAAEATALAGAAATGIGAGLVLLFAFVLAALSNSNQSNSAESQALVQLNDAINNLTDDVLAGYWQGKLQGIGNVWNTAQGGVGADLDDLANEGTGGFDVKKDVSQYHVNGMAFVNNFVPSKNPVAGLYWERPISPDQVFSAQFVPYMARPDSPSPTIMGWYGNLPQPQPGTPVGGTTNQMFVDPRTMLPYLVLGLQSYLTLEMMANMIDTSQPTFGMFVDSFKGDLSDYASFLLSQYQLAINGIVKSDMPSANDIISFACYSATSLYNTPWSTWGGSLPTPWYGVPPTPGYAWNGVNGVIDEYPQYGVYDPPPPVAVPSSSAAWIIDIMDTSNIVADLGQNFFTYPYVMKSTLADWVAPWVEDRLILGRMARWKAIYLYDGYDQVWSMIQRLTLLAGQPPVPTVALDQDGTMATGNWSARELCTVLNVDGDIFGAVNTDNLEQGTLITSLGPTLSGYSVFALVQVLDNIASGNWGGPPGNAPSRPLGLRDRLAAAAV
jgi:hypothetical protein